MACVCSFLTFALRTWPPSSLPLVPRMRFMPVSQAPWATFMREWLAADGLCCSDSLHRADHCLRAHVFFTSAVGAPSDALTPHGQNMGSHTCSFRDAYSALLSREASAWESYWRLRLQRRRWNASSCWSGLRSLLRSVPQNHRWHLLRLHLNGHYTSARLSVTRVLPDPGCCCFC